MNKKRFALKLFITLLAVAAFAFNLQAGRRIVSVQSEFSKSVSLLTLDNDIITSGALYNDGKPVVIVYWTTTCGPCKKEMRAINSRLTAWQKQTGVRVIAITPEKKSRLPIVKEIVKKYKWKNEVYMDFTKKLRQKLLGDWHGVPQTFVFDKDFNIMYHGYGFRRSTIKNIEKWIYQLAGTRR